jgi:hypothetical protein
MAPTNSTTKNLEFYIYFQIVLSGQGLFRLTGPAQQCKIGSGATASGTIPNGAVAQPVNVEGAIHRDDPSFTEESADFVNGLFCRLLRAICDGSNTAYRCGRKLSPV